MFTMTQISHTLTENMAQVQQRIAAACSEVQRDPQSVQLLAVSKTFSAQYVTAAVAAGQLDFGENYIQEAVDKMQTLNQQGVDQVTWHCIGAVQSRKTKAVAEHFHWLHSLERISIAQRISRQRPTHLTPLQVCIQVNMDAGDNKSGVKPDDVLQLAQDIDQLPNLQLRGLMSIPEPYDDPHRTLAVHQRTRELFDAVGAQLQLPHWDTLSMGMSADLELAIAAGSTMVRVGSSIFGPRAPKDNLA